jgi:hypothetical protein
MNDSRIIEELGVHGITIQPYMNGVANSDRIQVEFWQEVRTPYEFNDADRKSTSGKLIGKHGHYCGKMQHRFGVDSVQAAWPEIQRRARAYQQLEEALHAENPNPGAKE